MLKELQTAKRGERRLMHLSPTGFSKTELVFRMLISDDVFLPTPTRIKYHYGAWQNGFTEVEASDSRF